MSPKHPPKCQETARLRENPCFGKSRQKRFGSFEMASNLPLGNSRMLLDQPRKILKIFGFDPKPDTKSIRNT